MRKIFCYITLFCLFLFVIGCSLNKNEFENELISFQIDYTEGWMNSQLDKVGLSNYCLEKTLQGTFVPYSSDKNNLYLFCDYSENHDILYHNSCLVVETKNKVFFKHLSGSYSDELSVADIDGDQVDEIIVQSTVGMSGGAGQYMSRILKISENGLFDIFLSSTSDLFDTGFCSKLENNNKIKIKNRFTGYEIAIDIGNKYFGVFYDEAGSIINSKSILCDSFKAFYPIDVDEDGVFEISCIQYVSLNSHSDYIGDAETVIKFNPESKQFEVIKSAFVQEI